MFRFMKVVLVLFLTAHLLIFVVAAVQTYLRHRDFKRDGQQELDDLTDTLLGAIGYNMPLSIQEEM